ncbi:hypothetical protein [Curtobacterium sp. MCBD17_021]|uniref:hypothetical protein n=1 Tax=Curtobacterium sp. MCBD17_021 TaxID=2175665 RepID=UPI000DA706F3|nr:hypothetical protein [Curtobacterium sp. MCBD17_021]PZE66884.1 hypothetical protein DEI83_06130 [Curtobacterium sp. MCBD17_021]
MGVLLLGLGTGTGDPIAPEPLYSLGADDFSHRWAAERITGNPGDIVTVWPDSITPNTDDLRISSATSRPFVLATDTGEKVVSFRPTDATSLAATRAGGLGAAGTIAMVVRVDPGGTTGTRIFANAFGINFQKAGNNNYGISGNGGNAYRGGALDAWVLLIFETDGSSPLASGVPVVSVNGTESTALSGPITPAVNLTPLTLRATTSPAVEYRYAEVITWNRMLTAAERASVFAAVKNRYAFI